jgi:hypothetical protein
VSLECGETTKSDKVAMEFCTMFRHASPKLKLLGRLQTHNFTLLSINLTQVNYDSTSIITMCFSGDNILTRHLKKLGSFHTMFYKYDRDF